MVTAVGPAFRCDLVDRKSRPGDAELIGDRGRVLIGGAPRTTRHGGQLVIRTFAS
jgi:hypothetical protein